MTPSSDFDESIEKVGKYVQNIGHSVEEYGIEDVFEWDFESGTYSTHGIRCRAGEDVYLIVGHSDVEPMVVLYVFSLEQSLGNEIDRETAEAILEEMPEEEVDWRKEAASHLLEGLSDAEMAALETYLYMYVSGTSHVTNIYRDENEQISGFHVDCQIFPRLHDFDIRDLYDAVTTVRGAGSRGSRTLERTVFFSKDPENLSESEVKLNFNW